jgi:hypothetical protein
MASDISIVALALSTKIIDTEIKVRALGNLLVDKEIVTMKEIEEKYKFIEDRDFEKLKAEILELITEYAEKDEETVK